MPRKTVARALAVIGLLGCTSGSIRAESESESVLFVVPDTRDRIKCRGGTIVVLAVLTKNGLDTLLPFHDPPREFFLPAGRYRLYFMFSSLRLAVEGEGSSCDEFTSAHPIGFGFEVNGRDNYTVSLEENGVAVNPIVVSSLEWKQ